MSAKKSIAKDTLLQQLSAPEWQEPLRLLSRGIEREGLRIEPNGALAQDPHPSDLGAALTHPWITTDFSESLLELITPVFEDVDQMLAHLADTHHFVIDHIGEQQLWPLSMPCFLSSDESVPIAQYGCSHSGKMKTLYRIGLKHRYGAKMQAIAGLHFNFSLPGQLWSALGVDDTDKAQISARYFSLLRHFSRHAWIMAYLFGASPALCRSFIGEKTTTLPFEQKGELLYLPYATSLRMSDLGYTNAAQDQLNISLNSVDQYVLDLQAAIALPSKQYGEIGVKRGGQYQQINSNILQIENELYSSIRPKRTAQTGETPSSALARDGVEYIEVRALDINPMVPMGIDRQQILLLDLFLLDGLLLPSEAMTTEQEQELKANFEAVVLEGRKPGKMLQKEGKPIRLSHWLEMFFEQWQPLAKILDAAHGDTRYQDALKHYRPAATDPTQTLSAKVLTQILDQGYSSFGKKMACSHQQWAHERAYQHIDKKDFIARAKQSFIDQAERERQDKGSFEQYLTDYFSVIGVKQNYEDDY